MQYVHPNDLWRVWQQIRPGIEEILEELNKECLNELWLPEDVYASIKKGESVLLFGEEGFVVFQIQADNYTQTKKFFVWLGCSFDPSTNVLETAHQQLLDIAKQYQCQLMEFKSSRRGWHRRAKDMGFYTGPTSYVMRI